MKQDELRFYEAAFTLCLGDKEKGLETIDAINNAVKTMGPLVSDAGDLREYLYREVSFSSNDIASMLSADDRKGKDKEWWNNLPNAYQITSVGKALAYANAKRVYPALPSIE